MHLGRRRQCRPYISLDPPCLASIHYVVTLPGGNALHKLINNTFYQTASYDAFRICSLGEWMIVDVCLCHFHILLGLRGLYRGQWPQGHGGLLGHWPGQVVGRGRLLQ